MTTRHALLRLLSDGQLHSGTDMGKSLGISRAAVCKAAKSLGDSGFAIQRVPGRGYRLELAWVPLQRERILHELQCRVAAGAPEIAPASPVIPSSMATDTVIEILDETDSTNSHLLRLSPESIAGRVCLAECQIAGRGRRGRHWIATPWRNIMLSMAWRFDNGAAALAGLSLAAGVAVLRALRDYGVDGVGLKWPNDLWWQERKLAGLLVDIRGEASGPCVAVLGLGLNVHLSAADGADIDQPWIDLHDILGDTVDRNRLAALLIHHVRHMFQVFELTGLATFRSEWEANDCLAHKQVRLLQADTMTLGTVRGIDEIGALLIDDDKGELQRFYSGEISLRPVSVAAELNSGYCL